MKDMEGEIETMLIQLMTELEVFIQAMKNSQNHRKIAAGMGML